MTVWGGSCCQRRVPEVRPHMSPARAGTRDPNWSAHPLPDQHPQHSSDRHRHRTGGTNIAREFPYPLFLTVGRHRGGIFLGNWPRSLQRRNVTEWGSTSSPFPKTRRIKCLPNPGGNSQQRDQGLSKSRESACVTVGTVFMSSIITFCGKLMSSWKLILKEKHDDKGLFEGFQRYWAKKRLCTRKTQHRGITIRKSLQTHC